MNAYPAIDGDLIVWESAQHTTPTEYHLDIYGYDMMTGETTALMLDPDHQYLGDIQGEWVYVFDGNTRDIVVQNFYTGERHQLYHFENDHTFELPVAYKNTAVWKDNTAYSIQDIEIYVARQLTESVFLPIVVSTQE